MSFTFKDYDLSLHQTENDVTIRILDNKLFKIYQNTYNKISLYNFGIGTLSNFYKLCLNCLTSLGKNGVIEKSIENGQVKSFQVISSSIVIDMYFERDFIYEVKLDIPQIEEVKTSSDKLIIKQLTDEVKELKKYSATIERCHDLMAVLEVPICKYGTTNHEGYSYELSLSVPLLCPIITIICNDEPLAFANDTNNIYINRIAMINDNFKKVQNDTLKIVGFTDPIMDMSNMPSSTTYIEFINLDNTTISKMSHMKKLKKITFVNCYKLVDISEAIKDLDITQIVFTDYF
jgi:hypothetical protein